MDIHTIMKKEVILEEPECVPSEISCVVDDEFILGRSESSEADVHTLFLKEPDREQLIDESFSSGISTYADDGNKVVEFHNRKPTDGLTHTEADASQASPILAQLLTQQNTRQTNVKKLQCDVCNRTFSRPCFFSKHKLTHNDVKNYQCDVCNKVFTLPQHLKRHTLIHSSIKEHHCDVCNKAFTRSYDLSRHKLIHSGIEEHHCDVCGKAFTRLSGVSQQKVKHSHIKKYQCDSCNKAFIWLSDLYRHKLIHSGIKKYQCDVCSKKAFSQSQGLSKHKVNQ